MENGFLRIGQVAIACGVSVDTVRHYERRGLLPAASRSEANQRQYSRQAVPRVQLVRRGLQFGFSLKELAAFMHARDTGVPPCRAVRGAAEALLARVDAQVAELTRRRTIMRKTLRAWDARLANAPENAPARLLEALPLPVAGRRPPRALRQPG